MVIKLARKQNKNLRKYVLNYQAIKAIFKAKSSDQGIFLSIKHLDPGRRWFYNVYWFNRFPLETDSCVWLMIARVHNTSKGESI